MSETMTTPGRILARLQEDGYTPDDDGRWFDRTDSLYKGRTVRVIIDDTELALCGLDAHMVSEWDARVSLYAPHAMITAVLDQARDWASGPAGE